MSLESMITNSDPKVGDVRFIGVDGHGGSGKSTLAEILASRLKAEIIHTDDFAGWDNPNKWWPLIIDRVFKPIIKGANTLNYPRSKWWESHNPDPVEDQPVTSIMILEGVSSLRKEFRPYLSFSIYVDTPAEICLQRGFDRDKGLDGKPDKEILKMWQEWYEKEKNYMKRDNPKQYADIVLSGAYPFDAQLF